MESSKKYSEKSILKQYNKDINSKSKEYRFLVYWNRARFYEREAGKFKSELNGDSMELNKDKQKYYKRAIVDYDSVETCFARMEKETRSKYDSPILDLRVKCKAVSHLYTQQAIIDEYTNNIPLYNFKFGGYSSRASYFESIKRYKEAIADMDSCILFGANYPDVFVTRAKYKDEAGFYDKKEIAADLIKVGELLHSRTRFSEMSSSSWKDYNRLNKLYNDSAQLKK